VVLLGIDIGTSGTASSHKFLNSQALGPKLEWVRRHEPHVWQRPTDWYGSHSYSDRRSRRP
jgi:hypothetical protein